MPTLADPKKFESDICANDFVSTFNTVEVSEYAAANPTLASYGLLGYVVVGALKGPSL